MDWVDNNVQETDEDIQKFNSKREAESGSDCASEVVGNDEKSREGVDLANPVSPVKTLRGSVFAGENEIADYPAEELNLVPQFRRL